MNKNTVFLILTIAAVILLGCFKLDFYPQLSQGDHGRDLYSAQASLRGEVPYRDYWWVYGPLMPYYFAFFYQFAGSNIVSFLIGDLALKIASAAFFYLACLQVIPAMPAFLAAIWFSQSMPDFFFTFNHQAGITAELWVLFMLLAYIKKKKAKHLWMALPAVFLYLLIKVNFGLASLMMVLLALGYGFLHRQTSRELLIKFSAASALLLAAAALIYWLCLRGLNILEIRQCLPYFGDDQPYHYPPSMTLPYYFQQHWLTFIHTPVNMALGFILHCSTAVVIAALIGRRIIGEERRVLLSSLAVLGTFFVLNFQEFVVSGVWYRTYWSLPFLFAFHFIMMSFAFRFLPKILRGILWTIFAGFCIINLLAGFFTTVPQKIPPRLMTSPYGRIYVGNEPQWTQTVNAVSEFLNTNLKSDETFFALPYDDIYYYLTNKQSPTRMLIFFDHIKYTTQQEIKVIGELEHHKVAYVLVSNRYASSEHGLGIFGKTYCPLLAAYINQKYTPFARQGGDWNKEPGWGDNHGVMILKKK